MSAPYPKRQKLFDNPLYIGKDQKKVAAAWAKVKAEGDAQAAKTQLAKAAKTVREAVEAAGVDVRLINQMHSEIGGIPKDSVVGKDVVAYLKLASPLLKMSSEPDVQSALLEAVKHEIDVWYFS